MTSIAQFPFYVKQSDSQGCIPTNISATLQALGVHGITESHVFRAYLSTMCFSNIVNLGVLSSFRTNAGTLSDLLSLEFYDALSFEDWWSHVTDWLRNHRFVLFAFRINGGSHIRTAVNLVSSSDTIEAYDPDPGQPSTAIPMTKQELAAWWSQGKLNHDLLSISRR
jgi:hypothetical protein